MHTCAILKPCVIANMIYFLFVLGGFIHYFWKSMLMRKKKCLWLFLHSNILMFRYQIIFILKIIASFYKKNLPLITLST